LIKQISNNRTMLFSLAVCLVVFQIYVTLASPQVPYMDTMLFFAQIDRIINGEISWLRVYGAGEHRGFLYPAITSLEWGLWGADARVSTVLTGFVVTAIFFYWLKAFLYPQDDVRKTDGQVRIAFLICLASAFIIVSPAGFELWTLSLGFAQLVKNLLIVIFLYQLAIKRTWQKSFAWAIFCGVWGGSLILVATYGWSYPFLAAAFFVLFATVLHDPDTRKNAAIIFALMLFAQIIYTFSGGSVFSHVSPAGTITFSLANLISGFFYGAGTVFIGNEAIARLSLPLSVPIVLGALLLMVGFFTVLITLVQQSPAKIFLSGLLIFAVTVLAGVTLARGGVEFTNTGASRYFVDYVWLLLAPLAIIFITNARTPDSEPRSRFLSPLVLLLPLKIVMAILLIVAAAGYIATWVVELKSLPYRTATLEAMASVYRKGVQSEDDARLLQSPYPVAKRAVEFAQRYEIGVLRHDKPRCTLKDADYSGDWHSPEENDARWMGKQGRIALSKCSGIVTLKGYLPESFSGRKLSITYGDSYNEIMLEPGKEFSLRLDQMSIRRQIVTLQVDQITSPLLAGISADQRELGILLTYIGK